MQLFHNFSQKTIKVGEIFTTAKINLMHNDLTGVMRAGNAGFSKPSVQSNTLYIIYKPFSLLIKSLIMRYSSEYSGFWEH